MLKPTAKQILLTLAWGIPLSALGIFLGLPHSDFLIYIAVIFWPTFVVGKIFDLFEITSGIAIVIGIILNQFIYYYIIVAVVRHIRSKHQS